MKRCPECRRDYYDETLMYCLDDGSALLEGPGDERATAVLGHPEPDSSLTGPADERPTAILSDPGSVGGSRYDSRVKRSDAAGSRNNARSLTLAAGALLVLGGLSFAVYKFFGDTGSSANVPVRVTPFTSFTGVERNPAFSPDGKQVAFVWTGTKNDNFDIYVKLVGAGEPLRLTSDPAREMSPTWSPDGRFIAFIRTAGEGKGYYIIPALGGTERKLSDAFGWNEPGGVIPQFLDWSPDGKTLAVADKISANEPRSIFLISIDSGERRRITEPPPHYAGDIRVAFSPDGRSLAFTRAQTGAFAQGELYVMTVDGGEPKQIAADDLGINSLAWTRDAKYLIYSAGRAGTGALWKIPAAGGTSEPLAGIGDNAWDVSVSRQGELLIYAQLSVDIDIKQAGIAKQPNGQRVVSPPVDLISSTRIETFPRFSPDGARIAFQSNRSGSFEIWVCGRDGQNPIQITNFGAMTANPRWSADGRSIVFVGRSGGNSDIYVVNAGGGAPTRLTSEEFEDTAPAWSRDGQSIYFSSRRTGRFEVWKMPAGGGQAIQVTRDGGYNAVESADGRALYYSKDRNEPALRQMDLTTNEEKQIVEEQVYPDNWEVTAGGIYFVNRPEPAAPYSLKFFDFTTRKTTELTNFGPHPREFLIGGIAVSPDEQTLLIAQRHRLEYDLMLVENFR